MQVLSFQANLSFLADLFFQTNLFFQSDLTSQANLCLLVMVNLSSLSMANRPSTSSKVVQRKIPTPLVPSSLSRLTHS